MHPFDTHQKPPGEADAHARISSKIGFTLASSGDRRSSRPFLRRALRHQPLDARAWLGMLIAYRVLPARVVARRAHLAGKDI